MKFMKYEECFEFLSLAIMTTDVKKVGNIIGKYFVDKKYSAEEIIGCAKTLSEIFELTILEEAEKTLLNSKE